MKQKIEMDNVNYLFEKFGGNKDVIIGVDYLSEDDCGVDLVVYDTSNMNKKPTGIENFHQWISENGEDEESFEMDRVTLVKILL